LHHPQVINILKQDWDWKIRDWKYECHSLKVHLALGKLFFILL